MANALDAVLQMRREKIAREQAIGQGIASGVQGGIDNFLKFKQLRQNEQANRLNNVLNQAKMRKDLIEADNLAAQTQLLNSMLKTGGAQALNAASAGLPQGQAPVQEQGQATDPDNFITGFKAGPFNVSSASGIRREQQLKAEGQAAALTAKEEAKDKLGAQKGVTGTGRLLQQFERSVKELSNDFPEFGRVGVGGKLERAMIKGFTAFDEFPETKTLLTEIKPIANQSARDVEGGRVTDDDRKIYADALANTIARPSETNVRLVSNSLLRMADKGGDVSSVIKEFANSDIEIMQSIVQQTVTGLTREQAIALKEKLNAK